MKIELDIYNLGEFLYKVMETYETNILTKVNLSGGAMTITGKVKLVDRPNNIKTLKVNNIITLGINNNKEDIGFIKLTGIDNKLFNIELSKTKYKVIGTSSLALNKTRESNSECKIKIDDNIIFTIKESNYEDIKNMLLN